MGAPKGNQYAKKDNPKDADFTFKVHSHILLEMKKIAKSLGITLTEHIIRSATGKR